MWPVQFSWPCMLHGKQFYLTLFVFHKLPQKRLTFCKSMQIFFLQVLQLKQWHMVSLTPRELETSAKIDTWSNHQEQSVVKLCVVLRTWGVELPAEKNIWETNLTNWRVLVEDHKSPSCYGFTNLFCNFLCLDKDGQTSSVKQSWKECNDYVSWSKIRHTTLFSVSVWLRNLDIHQDQRALEIRLVQYIIACNAEPRGTLRKPADWKKNVAIQLKDHKYSIWQLLLQNCVKPSSAMSSCFE